MENYYEEQLKKTRAQLDELRSKYYAARDMIAFASGYTKASLPELSTQLEAFLDTANNADTH
jgi:hypothetical protein